MKQGSHKNRRDKYREKRKQKQRELIEGAKQKANPDSYVYLVKSKALDNLGLKEKQLGAVKSPQSKLKTVEDSEKRLVQNNESLEQVVAASGGREASMHLLYSFKVNIVSAVRDGLKKILEFYDNEGAVVASLRKPGDKIALLVTPEKSKGSCIQGGDGTGRKKKMKFSYR